MILNKSDVYDSLWDSNPHKLRYEAPRTALPAPAG